jgi:hypothetical protein
MRVLTVRQPWAALILDGSKAIENRTWRTTYRGPLAIHAGRRKDPAGPEEGPAGPTGCLLGVVDLVAVVPGREVVGQAFADGSAWAWILARPRGLVRPIPCGGRLGLWTLRAEDLPETDRAALAELLVPGPTARRLFV